MSKSGGDGLGTGGSRWRSRRKAGVGGLGGVKQLARDGMGAMVGGSSNANEGSARAMVQQDGQGDICGAG